MPPFRYEAFVNPYIGSISEEMGKRGDIDANAVTRVGDIQAADIARRGQAWGSAVEGLGNIAGKAFADYAQAKKDAPRLAEEAVLRQERVSAANDASQLRRGQEFLGTFQQKPDPNYLPNPATGESRLQGPAAPDNRDIYETGQYGVKTMNPQLAEQRLVEAGFGAHINQLMPLVDDQNKLNTEFLSGKRRVMGQAAQDALTIYRTTPGDESPTAWRTAVAFAGNSMVNNNVIRAEDLEDLIARGEPLNREGREAILFGLMKQGGAEITAQEPGKNLFINNIPTGGTTGERPPTPAEAEAQAFATPAGQRTPGQAAIVQGVKDRADAVRAPVAPPAPGSDASQVGLEVALFTAQKGRPPNVAEQLVIERRVSLQKPPTTDANAKIGGALQLANSLKTHPAYSKMLEIEGNYGAVQQGMRQANGVGDIAAINAIQHMIDVGVSVREADVALLQSAQPFFASLRAKLKSLESGAKLDPETRQSILVLARGLMSARAAGFNESVGKQYRAIANAYDIPYEFVGQDFEVPTEQADMPRPRSKP